MPLTWLLPMLLGASASSYAQTAPQVLSVSPPRNGLAVARTSGVTASFSQPMQAAAASATGLRVYSSQRGGLLAGTYSSTGPASASFQPASAFRAGEVIQVGVSKTLQSAAGASLARGHVSQFITATSPSDGTFASPGVSLPSQAYTYGVTTADFNGDGFLDIATCSQYTTHKVQVRFGQGNGNFGASTDYTVGAAYFLTSADLDNDGDLDLLVANFGYLWVMLNNGAGVFTTLPSLQVGGDSRTIAPADLDGDGNLDILLATASSGRIEVRFGAGDGTFSTTRVGYLSTGAPVGVAAGDVDGDGDLDLVTATAQGNSAYVRLNDGNGNFSGGSTLAVGGQPNSVALGDVNGDGALDIVTANQNFASNSISVALNANTAAGTFLPATSVTVGSSPRDVKLGDIDGDGDLDCVASGQPASILLNNGSGGFTVRATVPMLTYYLSLADVNNDGTLDLVAPNEAPSGASSVSVRLNARLPVVSAFTPASGAIGTSVSITGTNLSGTTGVLFNTTPATSFSVQSNTALTAVVPAGATSGRITVTTLPGVSGSSASSFVIPAPAVTSLSPDSGPAGTSVTIRGTGFLGTTHVTFNGLNVTSFTVNASGTQIQVTAPAGVTAGPLTVTTANGSSNSVQFTGAPWLFSLSPAFGPAGTSVTIDGVGLQVPTAVTFNGLAAPGFAANAAGTQLTVNAPAGVSSGPVIVTTANGTSNSLYFTAAPLISSFTPASGPVGTSVVITGTNLTNANQVRFGSATATSFTVNSATQVTATVPGGASTGPVQVRTPGGTATSTASFTVPAPTITALSPTMGPAYTAVTVTGTGFIGATGVTFNGQAASYFSVASATSLQAYTPLGVTTGPVVVTTPAGSSNGLLFTGTPTISGFSPSSGPPGTTVTITGVNLTDASLVAFNGVAAPVFSVVSPTQLTVVVPAQASTGRVQVTTPAGMATSNSNFTVPAPVITALTPAAGAAGTPVVISGTGFFGLTAVRFNGVPASGAVADPAGTSITVAAPGGVTTGPVVVTTSAGNSNAVLFTSAPTLLAMSPNFGGAGTQVTITGAGLANALQVTFNGVSAPGFTVNAAGTSLTVQAPAGVSTGPVVVSNVYGPSNALPFRLPPTITGFSPGTAPIGSSVVVTGTDFTGATRVTFNGAAAPSYAVNSATQLTAVVPAGATTGPLRVTTPAGTATSAGNLVIPSPALTLLTPAAGPIGAWVTITGTSLSGTTQVSFNGTAAAGFSVDPTGTELTARVPAGASSGLVIVTTINGVSNGLTFTVGPTITSLTPAFGGPGTPVTITGLNFAGATSVTFNGTPAPGFAVNAAGTAITVASPAGVTTGPVVVTSPLAASNGVLYTAAPQLTSFTPASGPVGTVVSIAGTDLHGATQVFFNSVPATNFTVTSPAQLLATVPLGATTGPIRVVTPRGSASSPAAFVVPAPGLTMVSPTAGPVGSTLTLSGTGFLGTTAVTINGTPAPGFTVNLAGTSITLTVPPAATSGNIIVAAPHGTSNGVAFVVPPLITGAAPAAATVGQTITLTGHTFSGATQVSFNGTATSSLVVVSPTELTVTVPAGAASGPLLLTTPSGVSNGFPFTVQPTVVRVQPAPNSIDVAPGAPIGVTFSRAVTSATASNQSIRAFGGQARGRLAGAYTGAGSAQVGLQPGTPYRPGETVSVTVAGSARAIDGTPLAKPYVYQFTAAAGPAPGTFTAGGIHLPTTGGTYSVTTGDFDRDGVVDVATVSNRTSPGGMMTIYYNSPTSGFGASSSLTIGPSNFITNADVDGDGDQDLLLTLLSGEVRVYQQDNNFSNFNFIAGVLATTPQSITPVDLNGDGALDMLVGCLDAGAVAYLNTGQGRFGAGTTVATGRILGLATGDVDGDGDMDLVVPDALNNTVTIRTNDGTGVFTTLATLPVPNNPRCVALGDLNRDGALDMLVAQYQAATPAQSTVNVFFNNGTGGFSAGAPVAVGPRPADIKLGDVDGDGDLDLLTTSESTRSVSIGLNNGLGQFATPYSVTVGNGPYALALADLDGDNTLDLATANSTSIASESVQVLYNRPPQRQWSGAVNSTWTTAGNWVGGVVPGSTEDVLIPFGAANYPVLSSGTTVVHSLRVSGGGHFTLGPLATLQVHGDWQMHGTSTLNGTVTFQGRAAQRIGGFGVLSFASLVVNKAQGTLSLQRSMAVTNSLTMTAGILRTNAFVLTTTGAVLSETDTSYVLGNVVNTLDVATAGVRYDFGRLGLALVGSGPALPRNTTVRRVTGTSLAGAGAAHSIERYYDITAATSTGLNLTLEFGYLDHELAGLPASDLALFRSGSGLAGPWQHIAGVRNASARTVTATGVSSFSVWTLGQMNTPLAALAGPTLPSQPAFQVYPTELTGSRLHYRFNGPLPAHATLTVYNATGQKVLAEQAATTATGTLVLPALPTGWYFVHLSSEAAQHTQRFYQQ